MVKRISPSFSPLVKIRPPALNPKVLKMKYFETLLALSLLGIVLLSGCVKPVVGNVKIIVTRYEGDCMPPVTRSPCCQGFPAKSIIIIVDGEKYVTDHNGVISLRLEENKTHSIRFPNCDNEYKELVVNITSEGIIYNETIVYGNAAYEQKTVKSKEEVRINLACCTA